ncbi:fungal specific transcription factor domain-containing protein [Drechmeria coniospora]|uniref:Fungal specific transcription factor domain-containing protein n=1 Tax=Drechmeria coniospora TaxID=98403 RepID=A0A151GN75_DRECN|nr:fungal specific transcription factor domain-containing protein [Drechmeria coniospora]KYK58565.1 fungal specific transcription factor domain-containing protein [Drechmeria coniospora]ODA83787.1 hypothetical protein RJ55_02303 [Drechmeria coniospora]
MDPSQIFSQGLGQFPPHQSHQSQEYVPQQAQQPQQPRNDHPLGSPGHRVAHTLTACCRCRQRKTRCDPTLPRCLPCERSGSVCEYLDPAKGKKINRYYVIKLQDRVKALEAELAQFTDDDGDYPSSNEDIVRPGGMIRLTAGDETPRYLGPSSGIAMTRLLMEEAKRYTDSHRISDLFPEVRARGQARMQSIQMTGPAAVRKPSYPMMSDHPAESLPRRETTDKLVEIFKHKSQLFWPVLHEVDFQRDLEAVYNGDTDPYRSFVVRMVIAIGMQKLEIQYAGLADSYYVAAMQYAEAVIRPKDLKTLQCLILIVQYSLQSPTRTPVYFVLGLATRICQQESLASEETITKGINLDPKSIDMRRRLVWIVATMEFSLSYNMGRPSGFARGDDRLDVDFFADVEDELITSAGIQPGSVSDRKLAAIHFYKSRALQAEVMRTLYEIKKPTPENHLDPWFGKMEQKMKDWVDASPSAPAWLKFQFTGFFHQMRIALYRPSPQVPKPLPHAAGICFESAVIVLKHTQAHMETGTVSITWVFLLTLNTALNALLWATSYPEVRQQHSRAEVEELIQMSLACLDKCVERWPGTAYTSELYGIISKACLQSYESGGTAGKQAAFAFPSPSPGLEPQSPPDAYAQSAHSRPDVTSPQFGFVFDSPPESMNTNYPFDPNFPAHPTFRSNSIFCNPATDMNGRRFSYFPPDFMHSADAGVGDLGAANPISPHHVQPSSAHHNSMQLPTPPDSVPPSAMSAASPSTTFSPTGMRQSSTLSDGAPDPSVLSVRSEMSPPPTYMTSQDHHHVPNFTTSQPQHQSMSQQRPLPTTTNSADWFYPSTSLVSPYTFGSTSSSFFGDSMPGHFSEPPSAGLGLHLMGAGFESASMFSFVPPGRQGSLTQSQQLKLMNVLETEGVGDMDAFLRAEENMSDVRWY